MAVTAYNYGAGGLIRAKHKLKTKDFNVIALNHHGNTFGFASRNFYAEFLAAMLTYNKSFANHKLAKIKSNTIKIKVPHRMNLSQVYKQLKISKKILKKYNACMSAGDLRNIYLTLTKKLPHYNTQISSEQKVEQALNKFNRNKFMRKKI